MARPKTTVGWRCLSAGDVQQVVNLRLPCAIKRIQESRGEASGLWTDLRRQFPAHSVEAESRADSLQRLGRAAGAKGAGDRREAASRACDSGHQGVPVGNAADPATVGDAVFRAGYRHDAPFILRELTGDRDHLGRRVCRIP